MGKNYGKVYITGAGCGDYDLITLRGLEAIKKCDVLIYDDLIDEKLLEYVPAGAEIIYMGKRNGRHSFLQQEINETIVKCAKSGKTVVRLKGGDPFVFGRGGEEATALIESGIDFEIIPGISSCIAIPAFAGIPVTHRKISRSFHVITAHTADTTDGLPDDFDNYASLKGTLVFLMGLTKIEQISKRLIAGGKDPETPSAVISGGNSREHATVRAALKNIAKAAQEAQVKSPAVIVVGDTAAMELKYLEEQ